MALANNPDFGGMKRDEQRLELLAYLRTLSNDPQPLRMGEDRHIGRSS